jgi:hypothetical protein
LNDNETIDHLGLSITKRLLKPLNLKSTQV